MLLVVKSTIPTLTMVYEIGSFAYSLPIATESHQRFVGFLPITVYRWTKGFIVKGVILFLRGLCNASIAVVLNKTKIKIYMCQSFHYFYYTSQYKKHGGHFGKCFISSNEIYYTWTCSSVRFFSYEHFGIVLCAADTHRYACSCIKSEKRIGHCKKLFVL